MGYSVSLRHFVSVLRPRASYRILMQVCIRRARRNLYEADEENEAEEVINKQNITELIPQVPATMGDLIPVSTCIFSQVMIWTDAESAITSLNVISSSVSGF